MTLLGTNKQEHIMIDPTILNPFARAPGFPRQRKVQAAQAAPLPPHLAALVKLARDPQGRPRSREQIITMAVKGGYARRSAGVWLDYLTYQGILK